MKRRIKAIAGRLLYSSSAYHRYWPGRALIAAFHRVDDRYPTDPITVTRQAFTGFLDFFTTYFQVVSLSELLTKLASNADISRHLVITFDDGYLDNWAIAAPELAARRLPACFFVTTGFIGGNSDAWWDAARGVRSEWMTWDHLRSLCSSGFELGAHTISHVNLAQADRATAAREIIESRLQLEAETSHAVRHFAYPFGGPEHLAPEQRELVKEAGFSSCVSAYGGRVRQGDDPYRLRRVGIDSSWFRSPYQFGLECLFDATTLNSADPADLLPRATSRKAGPVAS
jgi:peptidoglycan/xylan/chitin deacetylase (PgdA/CDA1 family)